MVDKTRICRTYEKLARTRGDSTSETLDDLRNDEEERRSMRTLGLDHEANAKQPDAEAEDEEPLDSSENECQSLAIGRAAAATHLRAAEV